MSRLPGKIEKKLREALRAAQLERASFGMPGDVVSVNGRPPEPFDAFVKNQVRLYLSSWVATPIGAVLAWAEGRAMR